MICKEIYNEYKEGIQSQDMASKREYGTNSTEIPENGKFTILFNEKLSPLYLF